MECAAASKRTSRLLDTRALGVATVSAAAGLVGAAVLPTEAHAYPYSRYCHSAKYNDSYCSTYYQRKYSHNEAETNYGFYPCVGYVNSIGAGYGPYCAPTSHASWVASYPAPYRNKEDYCFHETGGHRSLFCAASEPG